MGCEQINVGILGYGVVGGGAYRILGDNAEAIAQRSGCPVTVTRVADLDWEREREVMPPESAQTADAADVVNDPNVDIVVETIGGVSPAREYVLEAIGNGKAVVTANKELMAKHGAEILDAAAAARVDVEFEGSAGGGIPIIRSLKESLEGNAVREIAGILNGTTNYILTRMTEGGESFDEALSRAQELGYAEADPWADVEGDDAAYKIAILAAIAFGKRINIADVPREGISKITPADIQYASEMGYVIKLLAIARDEAGEIEVRVHPALVATSHPLGAVSDVFNAVLVRGDAVGDVMLYGRGAGALPTGSAIVGDIISIARNIRHGSMGRVACACQGHATMRPMGDVQTRKYVRMAVRDEPGVMGKVATIFGEESVSINSVIQRRSEGDVAEIVWETHLVSESAFRTALRRISDLDVVVATSSVIRVQE
ncbi:MAG: homoserine dehydrogenase [Armatimonadota bacterium]|jgi:homoserine dehydrogenase